MSDLSFARTFLATLDSKPSKISPEHVEDPRTYPARGAVLLSPRACEHLLPSSPLRLPILSLTNPFPVHPPPATPHPNQENPPRARRREIHHRLPQIPSKPASGYRAKESPAFDEYSGD